jgi:hypothetical protein
MRETGLREESVDVMPWYITAGADGLQKDAILVAVMDGDQMVSISLHVAHQPCAHGE